VQNEVSDSVHRNTFPFRCSKMERGVTTRIKEVFAEKHEVFLSHEFTASLPFCNYNLHSQSIPPNHSIISKPRSNNRHCTFISVAACGFVQALSVKLFDRSVSEQKSDLKTRHHWCLAFKSKSFLSVNTQKHVNNLAEIRLTLVMITHIKNVNVHLNHNRTTNFCAEPHMSESKKKRKWSNLHTNPSLI